MKFRKRVILFITLITMIVSGCSHNDSTSQYLNSAKQFNNIYFEMVENLDLSNTMKPLGQLQTKENKDNIQKLGVILEEIRKSIPKEREIFYDNFKQRYEDLVFLDESYSKLSILSTVDRRKIGIIVISIKGNIRNWKDKKSTAIWE